MNEKKSSISLDGNHSAPSRTLSLTTLRSFIAICETSSFRLAALQVGRSPSAISLQIGKLEELLEVKLLNRDARHVELTDKGGELLEQARRLISLNDETLRLFRQPSLAGHLCLSAPHDLGVSLAPSLLKRLAEVHPEVHVSVKLGTGKAVQQNLLDGNANLTLFNDIGPPSLKSQDLFSEPLIWTMLRGGQAPQHAPLPIAAAETGCAWREAAIQALHKTGIKHRIAYSSDTSMGQVAAIRGDLAIAALPQSFLGQDLVEVPPEYKLPKLPLTCIRMAHDGSDLAVAFGALIASEIKFRSKLKA